MLMQKMAVMATETRSVYRCCCLFVVYKLLCVDFITCPHFVNNFIHVYNSSDLRYFVMLMH